MTELKFTSMIPVTKGISEDKKYHVTKADGTEYLLRITPAKSCEKKKFLLALLEKVSLLDIPMCRLIESGDCREGMYSLYTWIHGRDAEEALPNLADTEQYALGIRSGEILRRVHSVSAPENIDSWGKRYHAVNEERLEAVRHCSVHFEGEKQLLEYIEKHISLIQNRPQAFLHGDYHIGNMMLTPEHELYLVDWDFADFDNFGDPWLEFNRIGWSAAQKAPYFAAGRLNGYFGGKPPVDFWKLFALYMAVSTITSIPWATQFGQDMINEIIEMNRDVLSWFDNMQNSVPDWYLTCRV